MSTAEFQIWVNQNTILALTGLILLCVLVFVFTRGVIARGFRAWKGTTDADPHFIVP